jgi:dynein heavy chain
MLEDLNRLLTSAELISLYNEKDQEEIMMACKADCLKLGKKPTK